MKEFWLNSEGRLEEGQYSGSEQIEYVRKGTVEEVIEILQRGCVAVTISTFPFSSVEKAFQDHLLSQKINLFIELFKFQLIY